MEGACSMGVPVNEPREDSRKDKQIHGSLALKSVELFSGAGGLALGIESAGFHHDTVVERDRNCCDTIRENQRSGLAALDGWRLYPGDVRNFDYSAIDGP